MVNSTCIVDGEDDLFGEDDHMAHHYNTTVYFKVSEMKRSDEIAKPTRLILMCGFHAYTVVVVLYQDLKEHQKSKEAEFARTKASVFHTLSIVELSILIILNVWDRIADHYVDYTGRFSIFSIFSIFSTNVSGFILTYTVCACVC